MQISLREVDGQTLRVGIRRGDRARPPLLMFNGIGACIELAEPFIDALQGPEAIIFDVPGVGGSPAPRLPYRPWMLARMSARLLDQFGYGQVDVLGVSWGGALAQQFAFQNPRRCRRLVLVSTGTGAMMVPARPRVLAKMATPRRFSDPDYAASIAGELYGGTVRAHGEDVARLFLQQLHAGSKMGYLHQLLAGSVWSSLFALPAVRQETLIVAGTDDPIIPVINAHIMNALLPHSRLHLHDGGHIDLVHNAVELAPVIETFLHEPGDRP